MKKLACLNLVVINMILISISVSGVPPFKKVNRYGAIITDSTKFVNKNGTIGLYGVSLNGGNVFVVPTLGSTTTVFPTSTQSGTSGGIILSDGGAAITARGVCYGLTANPVVSGSHTSDGTGKGTFISTISPLITNTRYHVRSYATNSVGTGYGTDVQYTPTSSCFIAGTKITMSDGGQKNIEEVKVGERVVTVDPATMQITTQTVARTFVHPAENDLIKITYGNGQSTTNTKSHPFFVEGKGWCCVDPKPFKDTKVINARQLLSGDKCKLLIDGKLVSLPILKIEALPNLLVPKYNFNVNKTHCYFANGILVHNK
jgi:Pretoxin HINT domain